MIKNKRRNKKMVELNKKINELKHDSRNINIKVKIEKKESEANVRTKKDNAEHRVARFKISDETGETILTVWDDEIDKIPVNEFIIIRNGFVNMWNNILFMNIGRFGSWIKAE
jgi:hypothetical protein